MVTLAPNPPGHWLDTAYWTLQPVAADAGSATTTAAAEAMARAEIHAATARRRLTMTVTFHVLDAALVDASKGSGGGCPSAET